MLEINNIDVFVDQQKIIDDLSLKLDNNKIGCLLGPSGSGKTTLLQTIAGFIQPQKGRIVINGVTVDNEHHHTATEKRNLSMVFQDYALFPHLTVHKNIEFGIYKLPSEEKRKILNQMLELCSLTRYAKRYPHELSGGQQQRVALARALATDPKVLLLDEPFSNLDANLKLNIIRDVREILLAKNITSLVITHDQEEALSMADMLGVIDNGKLLQWDSAYNIYHEPNSIEIATFVGMGGMIRGTISDNQVSTILGTFNLNDSTNFKNGSLVKVLIRPDDIIHNDESTQYATIDQKQFRGSEFLYRLRLDNGETIACFAPSHHNHHIGEKIGIITDIEHVIVFP